MNSDFCILVWHKARHPTGAWMVKIHLWACPKCVSTMARDMLGVGKYIFSQSEAGKILIFQCQPWRTV